MAKNGRSRLARRLKEHEKRRSKLIICWQCKSEYRDRDLFYRHQRTCYKPWNEE